MKTIKKHLIKIGLGVIAIGFLYDVFFAGIPYQDPTTEMLVKYNRNTSIALVLQQIGLAITVMGIVVKIFFQKREINRY
ncbi:MAG TPA: hypothetical protein VK623_10970 [Flavobacterium sp.]|nr:hypothetical protein [Flavobacterium sp.]